MARRSAKTATVRLRLTQADLVRCRQPPVPALLEVEAHGLVPQHAGARVRGVLAEPDVAVDGIEVDADEIPAGAAPPVPVLDASRVKHATLGARRAGDIQSCLLP